jgi:hypothetical protein
MTHIDFEDSLNVTSFNETEEEKPVIADPDVGYSF